MRFRLPRRAVVATLTAAMGAVLAPLAMTSPAAAASVPPAPTNLRVISHDAIRVALAWDSTEPRDGYTMFNIFANGIRIYHTPAASATVCCLTPGETYDITVTVKRPDTGLAVGPESAPSRPVRVTMDADDTPPPAPDNLRLFGRDTPTVLGFQWTQERDNVSNVVRWELSYAGRTSVINYSTARFENVTGLDLQPGNSYPFELRAVDLAGNRSQTPARFEFETTPPSQPRDLRLLGVSDGFPTLVEWTPATDNSGAIRDHEVFLDGQSIGRTGRSGNTVDLAEQIFNIGCVPPPIGPGTIQVRALDASLNPGELSPPLTVEFPPI